MTEFVRVRQFDSERGAGNFFLADYLFSAMHRLRIQNILKNIFLKSQKKQTYMYMEKGVVVEVQ